MFCVLYHVVFYMQITNFLNILSTFFINGCIDELNKSELSRLKAVNLESFTFQVTVWSLS